MTVLKMADDKQPHLDALQALLDRTDIDERARGRIKDEIWTLRSGIQGERDAAYEIDFHYGLGQNHAVIHDLRIEYNGRVAQIDHLIVNRAFDVWICETKSFSQGVKINDLGEWSRYGAKFATGIASPIEQNRRHVVVLEEVLRSGAIRLPRRLLSLKPTLRPVVLVSNGARIDRPKSKRARDAIDGLDTVIKVDQLVTTINRSIDTRNPLGLIAKLVGRETVHDLGRQLAGLHKPATFDWAAKFGLPSSLRPGPAPVSPAGPRVADPATCESCGRRLSDRTVKFIIEHSDRFDGKSLCFDCQRSFRRFSNRALQ